MGMDLTTYRLVRPLSQAESAESNTARTLFLTAEQQAFLQARFPDMTVRLQQYLDLDALRREFSVPDTHQVGDWDLTLGAHSWASFEADGCPDFLVSVPDPAKFIVTASRMLADFELEQVGYLRKPFRLNDSDSSYVEGDTLVLRTGNFAGANVQGIGDILGKEAMDDAVALLLPENIDQAQALASHCFDKALWEAHVLRWLQEPDYVTIIDW